ncbi:hypothetical protein L1987_17954 [Smallanthus sonchifolius]|uniref:Uncharacterized protein n=1 Tax=Smallanthus sonchifolius TaxID=185202 RepID=A0ACB9J0D7_9ASTR|nr:hypothetical protein L1987_17954 [Smallanthus sonchifolius]
MSMIAHRSFETALLQNPFSRTLITFELLFGNMIAFNAKIFINSLKFIIGKSSLCSSPKSNLDRSGQIDQFLPLWS